jgi:hypothetical protein
MIRKNRAHSRLDDFRALQNAGQKGAPKKRCVKLAMQAARMTASSSMKKHSRTNAACVLM